MAAGSAVYCKARATATYSYVGMYEHYVAVAVVVEAN